jgi:hypothetical protein
MAKAFPKTEELRHISKLKYYFTSTKYLNFERNWTLFIKN